MGKQVFGIVGGVIAAILFISVNVVANNSLRSARIDLTEQSLFTLSSGSTNIASNIDEELHLYYYFSKGAARQFQEVVDYERRVRDVLEEYVRRSDGKIVLEVIDPEPFSENEERAVRDGIAGIQTMTDTLYFGMCGTNATDDRQVIPFFGERVGGGISFAAKERFLEYDISRLLHSLAHPQKAVVGVLSSLPLEGAAPPNPMMPQQQQQQLPRWKFLDQLSNFYDVRMLDTSSAEIDSDLDALVLVHPREFSDTLQYAIDQYVMRGGKLVAFVDPNCDADMSNADPSNPMGQFGKSKASDLNKLFKAWGFEVVPNKVVGDYDNGVQIQVRGADGRAVPVNYVAWVQLGDDALDREDPVTSLLQNLLVITAGSLRATAGATTTFTPLVETSENSMEIDVGRFLFQPNPQEMLESFVSGKTPLPVAARISGETASAFPDGPPSGAPAAEHLAASNGPIHVITVADADMLADQWWLRENVVAGFNFGSRVISDNCDLLVHSIENLTGGEDLISIRARGKFSRPFDRVDEIERDARRRFTDKQQELQRKMQAAEEEIAKLGQERDPNDPNAQFLFSPEQQAAYENALETRTTLRRQLRDVQHDMDKDINALGRKLKAINIFAVPVLVSILAIGLGIWRVQRRGQ